MLNLLYPLMSLLQFVHVEVALLVWEVLSLDASSDNFLVFIIHSQPWDI